MSPWFDVFVPRTRPCAASGLSSLLRNKVRKTLSRRLRREGASGRQRRRGEHRLLQALEDVGEAAVQGAGQRVPVQRDGAGGTRSAVDRELDVGERQVGADL